MRPKFALRPLRSMLLVTLVLAAGFIGWRTLPLPRVSAKTVKVAPVETLRITEQADTALIVRNGSTIATEYTTHIDLSRAEPLALAVGDFDADGVPDLVCGYAVGKGGFIALHRGNIASIFPHGQTDPASPFLAQTELFTTSGRPDLITTGDFDNDGQQDVVTAERGGNRLEFLRGGANGKLTAQEKITLAGTVTALASGELNRRDGLTDLVVGLSRGTGAQVVIFESAHGALKPAPGAAAGTFATETFELTAAPTALAVLASGDRALGALAIAAGNELVFIHGRDRQLTLNQEHRGESHAVVSRQVFAAEIAAMTSGNFTNGATAEIIVLTSDGSLVSVSERTNGAKPEEIVSTRISYPSPSIPFSSAKIIAANVAGGHGSSELILLDQVNRRMHLLTTERGQVQSRPNARISATFDADAIAALPMRLNQDGLDDIVFLSQGQIAPSVAMTAPAAVFTVNSTANNGDALVGNGICEIAPAGSGICTLRAAIQEANASAAADEIRFNLAVTPTIAPTSPYPVITRPVTIDGTTQPGFAGTPIVELNGASSNAAGLTLDGENAANSVIRGLVINRFPGGGIILGDVNGVRVEGNFIGTNIPGTAALGNGGTGTVLGSGLTVSGFNNTIGGRTPAARNLVSGNSFHGIDVFGSTDVEGNFVGTNVTGTGPLGNCSQIGDPTFCSGIKVGSSGAPSVMTTRVGGTAPGARNLVSGNLGNGIFVQGQGVSESSGIEIEGNFIGTDVSGTIDLGNALSGILTDRLAIFGAHIGGLGLDGFNLISGNERHGIAMIESSGVFVEANLIGTRLNGENLLLNGRHGIFLLNRTGASIIGGDTATPGECDSVCNTIAFASGFEGVALNNFTSNPLAPELADGNDNGIRKNRFMFPAASDLIVDLRDNGRTFNDLGDTDTGENGLQNFANITQINPVPGGVRAQGNLNSTPNTAFSIDFYLARSGAEGRTATFVHSIQVTTNANGDAPFDVTINEDIETDDKLFSITTTSVGRDSSEASPPVFVNQQNCTFAVDPTVFNQPREGGPIQINVTTQAGCIWTAASNSNFITLEFIVGDIGVGSEVAGFRVAFNSGAARQGTVTVAGQTVTVNQASAQGCSFNLNPTSFNVSAAGGNITVNVTTQPTCAWTGVSQSAFITGGGGGTGSGSVTFNVLPNTGTIAALNPEAERTDTVLIGGQLVSVVQATACSFNVSPLAFTVPAGGDALVVGVNTSVGCGWTAVSQSPFITGGGTGSGPGPAPFNMGPNITGEEITATMLVAGQTVTATQAPCTYSISPISTNVPVEGGEDFTVNVMTQSGCPWAAIESDLFITTSGGGVGPGSFTFDVPGNPGTQRNAIIKVGQLASSVNHTVRQDGCSYFFLPGVISFSANAGVRNVTLLTTANTCGWSAFGDEQVTATPATGTGTTVLTIRMPRNEGGARDNVIVINPTESFLRVEQTGKNNSLDFDGDNKVDIAMAGPVGSSSNTPFSVDSKSDAQLKWSVINSGVGNTTNAFFGLSGDRVVPGDFNGDGKSDLAVWRPSDATWYIARPNTDGVQAFDAIPFGLPTDKPVPADYDGDGKTDIAVFRPADGVWWILQSADGQVRAVNWGLGTDKLVPGDYDGDGRADIAVWRPSDRIWYILQSSDNTPRFVQFGLGADRPVPGDYDGDFKNDIAVFRPADGNWFILRSGDNTVQAQNWGLAGDVLVPADYDGDLKTDIAVWRPSDGFWFILRTSNNALHVEQLGQPGDRPVPAALVPD